MNVWSVVVIDSHGKLIQVKIKEMRLKIGVFTYLSPNGWPVRGNQDKKVNDIRLKCFVPDGGSCDLTLPVSIIGLKINIVDG